MNQPSYLHFHTDYSIGIRGGIFFVFVILLGVVYIYGINKSVVEGLDIERVHQTLAWVEEEIHLLEAERAKMGVGFSLDTKARELGLSDTGPIHFLSRVGSFAQRDQ